MLTDLALRDRPVALVVSDQRMPEMTGIELLDQVASTVARAPSCCCSRRTPTPTSRSGRSTTSASTTTCSSRGTRPSDRLYPVVDDLLGDWRRDHPDVTSPACAWSGTGGRSAATSVKMFLARNHVPYRWLDVERDDEAASSSSSPRPAPRTCPWCWCPTARRCGRPTTVAVADALGLRTRREQPLYDLCIVGGGPAGLAAAVYAASEGLRTVVVEREAPGGQAGQSASIENYLGFPKGLSGADLTHRAVAQAARSAPRWCWPATSSALETRGPGPGGPRRRRGRDRGAGRAGRDRRLLPPAGGARPRAADRPRGVYYGATASEAAQCEGEDVYVVGAANSAGQAAAQLRAARQARRHGRPRRRASRTPCRSTSSRRIQATPNIEVRLRTEVVAVHGDGPPGGRHPGRPETGVEEEVADQLAVRVHRRAHRGPTGSATTWRGTRTGSSSPATTCWSPEHAGAGRCRARRSPSRPACPGVFAAGDVRLDSMKRVASAVGEGAMSVYLVHRYLATM